jgi:cation diffusion facilitator CzcD-associated flavoprotein CzcO
MPTPRVSEHFDVLIVGAGISGISGAWHLVHRSPGTRFAILESKASFGGTWITHRFPGIRSDSDLYTFGYGFKPWVGKPIATAEEILRYMGEVIEENDLARFIRYGQRLERAAWSGAERRWRLEVRRLDTGEVLDLTAGFLWMCQGYYDHDRPYTPDWPGMKSFEGPIVHPQAWPEALEVKGKRLVVIGSGATAATIIPALAERGAQVTMLQRSPTFFRTGRNRIDLVEQLEPLDLPPEWMHEIIRRKILLEQSSFARQAREHPDAVRKLLVGEIRKLVGEQLDVERHFNPRYRPWQQRIAFVPDADLFVAMQRGQAAVVTGEIECFTERGIRLVSGEELQADIIVTATGFNIAALGGAAFTVDGKPLDWARTVGWHGAMFTGVPNLLWTFGYLRYSWTLRADLLAELVCRLLAHLKARGAQVVTPRLREHERDMPLLPWVEAEEFNPGYLQRGLHRWPRQGPGDPWRNEQDYWVERKTLPAADFEDGTLVFG